MKGGIYLAEWWGTMPSFEKLFWFFAIPFTVVFLIQLIMLFTGLGDDSSDMMGDGGDLLDGSFDDTSMLDGDFDDSNDGISSNIFKVLSIRNVITFFTIFGWSGITVYSTGVGKIITVIASILFALAVTVLMSILFFSILRLTESGNINLEDAVGHVGDVYIPIPANQSGIGKVHITFNNVFREVDAVTSGEALPTGTKVLIVKLRKDDSFVVTKTDVKGW